MNERNFIQKSVAGLVALPIFSGKKSQYRSIDAVRSWTKREFLGLKLGTPTRPGIQFSEHPRILIAHYKRLDDTVIPVDISLTRVQSILKNEGHASARQFIYEVVRRRFAYAKSA